uniref:Transmembrane protein n=1 Tax=Medicago truncatula TaxID=3880 RepID=I3STQ1_MEDTR|nr:unknown [Medicago truncatula]
MFSTTLAAVTLLLFSVARRRLSQRNTTPTLPTLTT